MRRDDFITDESEPDIVQVVLDRLCARVPGISDEVRRLVEAEVKAQHGGRRLYVPKGAKRLTPEQRQALFQDGLSNMATHEITSKHKISVRTLERQMKRGGRFGGP